jgi:hydrogenase-4 component B
MLALAGACVAIGLVPAFFWPAVAAAVGSWHPAWAGTETPSSLVSLGWFNVWVTALGVVGAMVLVRRAYRAGLRQSLTWDCGFAAPTTRMQYTAGSFAGIITGWFAFILRPERHEHEPVGPLPIAASLTEHTPETVLEYLVEPVSAVVLRAARAARALQHGGVQSYLLYVFIGIAALAGVVWVGVRP